MESRSSCIHARSTGPGSSKRTCRPIESVMDFRGVTEVITGLGCLPTDHQEYVPNFRFPRTILRIWDKANYCNSSETH